MRTAALAVVCVLVLLAGCSAISPGGDATTTDVSPGETTGAATTTDSGTAAGATDEEQSGTVASTDTADTAGTDTGNATEPATGTDSPGTTDTAAGADSTEGTSEAGEGTDATPGSADALPDPASDRLGWEGGYWYNESLSVSPGDGLNASERRAVVNRTMARIELVRGLEFTQSVPVSVVTREEFQRSGGAGGGGQPSPAFRAFDNAKFEALFMIGEEEDSLAVQQSNRNQSVAGYYSPRDDSIVVISESDTPRLSRSTLAHELVHALQDQQFGLSVPPTPTRDEVNARNGLIEGDATYVQRRYEERCMGDASDGNGANNGNGTSQWTCLDVSANADAGGNNTSAPDLNFGVYFLQFFPYSDGPGFVEYVYDQQGWEGVNALYEDLPASAEQVIYPERYGEDPPANVSIRGTNAEGWERVRLDRPRPDYAELGQSGLSAMFAYTAFDQYNASSGSSVVSPMEFYNAGIGGVNESDPLNYGLSVTEGWEGDRLHVYRNGAGETGYVWKIVWDSPGEAEEFVAGYEALLAHWGGERVSTSDDTQVWRVRQDSPFSDAFRIDRQGDTVTIVNAPAVDGLSAVHANTSSS